MREICFRGKTYDKEWVEGSIHIEYGETTKDGKRDKDYRILGMRGECRYVIPETVGQFTGLYDNTKWEELTTEEKIKFLLSENGDTRSKEDWKGKPIFEGDIVKCGKWEYGRKPMYGHIVYGTCCFCVQDINSKNNPAMDLCRDFKVIGNIHDNPELLEVSK